MWQLVKLGTSCGVGATAFCANAPAFAQRAHLAHKHLQNNHLGFVRMQQVAWKGNDSFFKHKAKAPPANAWAFALCSWSYC
jgi:hypothetical protein